MGMSSVLATTIDVVSWELGNHVGDCLISITSRLPEAILQGNVEHNKALLLVLIFFGKPWLSHRKAKISLIILMKENVNKSSK